MSKLTLYKNDEPRPEMDEMLSEFFQAEMPKQWPAFKAPKTARTRETPSLWARYRGRLALAACVTLLVAGYWSLSGSLPEHHPSGLPTVGPRIGHIPKKDGNLARPQTQGDSVNPDGPNPSAK